jgi:hypothetical protein
VASSIYIFLQFLYILLSRTISGLLPFRLVCWLQVSQFCGYMWQNTLHTAMAEESLGDKLIGMAQRFVVTNKTGGHFGTRYQVG